MAVSNPLVDFLASYGPSSSPDNQYDEHVHAAVARSGVKPIEIKASRLKDVVENFKRPDPDSVILTGTAGDGKTYHCRCAWEELGGDPAAWGRGHRQMSLTLEGSGRELVVVKDLSELGDEEKRGMVGRFSESVDGRDPGRVFLLAANDGQLLSSLEERVHEELFRKVEKMLVEDREGEPGNGLRLFNLSRQDPSGDLDKIIDEVVEHDDWARCAGCPLHREGEDEACPIRFNRKLLRRDGGPNPLRERLADLMTLAKANDLHLPIRHLFLLAANILLGDRKVNSRLLTCRKAKKRSETGEHWATNPYANAFGENLWEKEREQYQSFTVLHSFGVGRETSNEIDDLLIYGPYRQQERYDRIVGADARHGGGGEYGRLRKDYVEGERKEEAKFLSALVNQRRRLFFTLGTGDGLRPWDLTVYRSAGDYLGFKRGLEDGRRLPEIENRLVCGLNRTFCGMMIDDTRKVYVTSSGGDGRGRISPVLEEEIPASGRSRGLRVGFEAGPAAVFFGAAGDEVLRVPLRLTHFEYLVRIAAGSLPANFSRQCHEDFLDTKTRLIEALAEPGCRGHFSMLTVQSNGHPLLHEVQIREHKDEA